MVSMIQEYHLRGSLRAFWVWVLRDPGGTPYFFYGELVEPLFFCASLFPIIKDSFSISPMLIYKTVNLILTFGMIQNYD